MSKKSKKEPQPLHNRQGDIYFFHPQTQNWEPLYCFANDGVLRVYKNKEKEQELEDKRINLGEIQGVSPMKKVKGIRSFTLIMSFVEKFQVGFPKKTIAKEWSSFLNNESAFWSVNRKREGEENPLTTPTKTAPMSDKDFFSLEKPKEGRSSIWQKPRVEDPSHKTDPLFPQQSHFYKDGQSTPEMMDSARTDRRMTNTTQHEGYYDQDPQQQGVQDIIENEDEEKILINENALYKHLTLELMPLRMREILLAVQGRSSLFKLTTRERIVYHEKGLAIFCAQERKAENWVELLKFSLNFKKLSDNWKRVLNSSYLWSFKAYCSVNQPVLDVFNSLMHYESYPYWNPATPTIRKLFDFKDGNTVLTERVLKPQRDYMPERMLHVLSTPVTIISGRECFYIIETSVPYDSPGAASGVRPMKQAKMPISVIEVREHPQNKERTLISHYLQFDPNVGFHRSARYSQNYAVDIIKTTYTALISDLMDSPFGRNTDDKLSKIISQQNKVVLGYSLRSVQNRTNFTAVITSEGKEEGGFEQKKDDVPEDLEGMLGNFGNVRDSVAQYEEVKQRPRKNQDEDGMDFEQDIEDEEEGCAQIFTKMYYTLDPKVGLIFTNKAIISKQRKALSYMLKRLGLAIFTGKGINSISLPANLFEPSTYLVRLAIEFQFAPVFISKAAKEKEPIEQIKYLMCFALASMLLTLSMEKPFNPILGETFEATVGNDCSLALEQISHHPPISAVQADSSEYKAEGHFEYRGDNGANSLNASKIGYLNVHLNNTGLDYVITYPSCKISGTMFGRRTFNYNGMLKIVCEKAGLQAFIIYNPDIKGALKSLLGRKQRADYIRGAIIDDMKFEPSRKNLHKVPESATVTTIEGIWTQHVEFDGNRYWDINVEKPVKLDQLGDRSLHSDSSRREDMLEVIRKDFQSAQVWKEKLENLQRADRKAREKFRKIAKKAAKQKTKK